MIKFAQDTNQLTFDIFISKINQVQYGKTDAFKLEDL